MNTSVVVVLFRPDQGDIDNIQEMSKTIEGVVVDNSPEKNFEDDTIGYFHYFF